EERVEEALAARLREEDAAEADEPARGDAELGAGAARAERVHGDELATPLAELGGHGADELVGDVGDHALDGLAEHSVDHARDDLGHAERELVALAAHGLGEDAEHELAAAVDVERLGLVRLLDAHRDVPLGLLEE